MNKFNKAEILENGTIQLREVQILTLADGSDYDTGKYHRRIFTPDQEINTIDCDRCKTIAQAVWTDEIIEAYNQSITDTGV